MIFYLRHDTARRLACEAVRNAPDGWVCRVTEGTRNLEQNAKFHAICGDIAKQQQYMGRWLKPIQWKCLLISGHAMATGLGADVVPGLEGEFVNIRESSAEMSVSRMSSLIEYTLAWCAENDVELSDGS